MNTIESSKEENSSDIVLKTGSEEIRISGSLTKESAPALYFRLKKAGLPSGVKRIDLRGLTRVDTSGVALIEWLRKTAEGDPSLDYEGVSSEIAKLIEEFTSKAAQGETEKEVPDGLLEKLGGRLFDGFESSGRFLVLMAEIFYWSAAGIFSKAQRRAGSVFDQCRVIGLQSLPLIALLSLILGVILSLQSAIQLRTFGANIYVADLMAISMVTEMGPMMSAILIAGRSGSAIASEIATMKVSEEIEALQVMGIDPLRYVVVPKFLAITLTIPLLVAFSIYLGVSGGILVGFSSLDIAPSIFLSRSAAAVSSADIVKSLTKSVFFGWVIVVISSHFGFSVSGGAEEVGNATTQAVVYSIISVIVLDALFSLTSLV